MKTNFPVRKVGGFPDRMSELGHIIVAVFAEYLLSIKQLTPMFMILKTMIIIAFQLARILKFREGIYSAKVIQLNRAEIRFAPRYI